MPSTTTKLAIPYPSGSDAPDGPGAVYPLAKWLDDHVAPADRFCHLAWNSSTTDQGFSAQTWSAMSFDTTIADPNGMVASQSTVTALWAGRYSCEIRAAVTKAATDPVLLEVFDQTTNTELASTAVAAAPAGGPLLHRSEIVVAQGDVLQARIYAATANAVQRGTLRQTRPEFILRWLGTV